MSSLPARIGVLAAVVLVGAAACSGGGEEQDEAPAAAEETAVERLERVTAITCSPSRRHQALTHGAGAFCAPFDSIPALDAPELVPAASEALPGREPVVALSLRGEERAYPVRYLLFHEIVSDEVAGVPVVVSFCPLCNSTAAHVRRLDGRKLRFGVSGQLDNANLVMFDRWGCASRRAGASSTAPDPYLGYDTDPAEPSPFAQGAGEDVRLPSRWRVVGVSTGRSRRLPGARGPASRGSLGPARRDAACRVLPVRRRPSREGRDPRRVACGLRGDRLRGAPRRAGAAFRARRWGALPRDAHRLDVRRVGPWARRPPGRPAARARAAGDRVLVRLGALPPPDRVAGEG